jgi:hypothetical protein
MIPSIDQSGNLVWEPEDSELTTTGEPDIILPESRPATDAEKEFFIVMQAYRKAYDTAMLAMVAVQAEAGLQGIDTRRIDRARRVAKDVLRAIE